jgi:hypothetical protein
MMLFFISSKENGSFLGELPIKGLEWNWVPFAEENRN